MAKIKKRELDLPIGMRNIKTTLAVFLCLVIYWLIGREDNLLAVTSAIICMQSSVETSVSTGASRLLGTAIGAFWGMLMLLIQLFVPIYVIVLASVGVMLLIWLCNRIRQPDAIVMACIVFLVIILGESGDNPILYSFNRLLDTFVGIAIAVIINRFVRTPPILLEDSPSDSLGNGKPLQVPMEEEHDGAEPPDTIKPE